MKASFASLHPGALVRLLGFLACLALCAAGAARLSAQGARTGTVSGVVSNQATGDLLPGALITVEGTGVTAIAERGGGFSLTVPEGTQTLVVSFSGLDTARVPVTVTAGQTSNQEVK